MAMMFYFYLAFNFHIVKSQWQDVKTKIQFFFDPHSSPPTPLIFPQIAPKSHKMD